MSKKPRKWSNLQGQLPDDPEQTNVSDWMLEVFKVKDNELASKTMRELQDEWTDLEEEEEFAALAEAKRNIRYRALELRILEELVKVKEVAGTDMWRGERKTFSPQYSPKPTVKDPAVLRQWIEDTGQQDLLTLAAPRLLSIVCEALDTEAAASMTPAQRAELKRGEPSSGLPPPGVEVFLRTKVHHTTVKSGRPAPPDDDVPF